MTTRIQRYGLVALVFLGLALVAACGGTKKEGRRIMPDPSFSWNLVEVPEDWPKENKDWPKDPDAALRQQQVYERYGKPDYFRVLWFKDGRLVSEMDVSQLALGKTGRQLRVFLKDQEYEWVYLDEDLTFRFDKRGVKKGTASDQLRTIAEYGDPGEIKEVKDVADGVVVKYTYYGIGRIFVFRDNTKLREEVIQAVPGMRMRK